MRKIYLRLLPLAFITYSLCYIDRINATFAGLASLGMLFFIPQIRCLGTPMPPPSSV